MLNNSITIIAKSLVKVIVTDKFKEETRISLQNNLRELEDRKTQIAFQTQYYNQKLEQDIKQLNAVMQKLKAMEQDINANINQLKERLQQVLNWQEGQEVNHSQTQSLIELQEGDNYIEALSKEIVIKDGVIVEIRSPGGK